MSLPTSVVCPVDFSTHAERALRHAVALAAAFHVPLTVVTVNDPLLVEAATAAGHRDTLRDQVEAALIDTLNRVPTPATRVLPAIEIITGAAADEILRIADHMDAGLIVMGTQGLGGASKLMFGSTTERVLRASHLPVLAVPAYAPERITVDRGAARFTLGAIVAAVGLDAADGAVTRTAAEWAAAAGATLVLAHVCPEAPAPAWWPFSGHPRPADSLDAARAQVAALAQSLVPATTAVVDVRSGAVPSGVASMARDHGAGLLVVSRGSGEHRLGAVAYRIMCDAEIPTLVVAG